VTKACGGTKIANRLPAGFASENLRGLRDFRRRNFVAGASQSCFTSAPRRSASKRRSSCVFKLWSIIYAEHRNCEQTRRT